MEQKTNHSKSNNDKEEPSNRRNHTTKGNMNEQYQGTGGN